MEINNKIKVLNKEVGLLTYNENDFISLTDIAKYKNSEHPADIIKNWTRSKETIEFLGLWEKINNPKFKLCISGKLGWYYEESITSPKKFGVEDSVLFLGRTSDSELPALLSGATAFVSTSLEEGFGLPLL